MDMFILLASPIIAINQWLFGSGLDYLLIKSLFSTQKKEEKDLLKHIKKRRPLKISCCSWLFNRPNYIMKKKAKSIVSDELDIEAFLRGQFLNKTSQKLLFTQLERFLLSSQARPYVIDSKIEPSKFKDKTEGKYYKAQIQQSRYYKRLLQGVYDEIQSDLDLQQSENRLET